MLLWLLLKRFLRIASHREWTCGSCYMSCCTSFGSRNIPILCAQSPSTSQIPLQPPQQPLEYSLQHYFPVRQVTGEGLWKACHLWVTHWACGHTLITTMPSLLCSGTRSHFKRVLEDVNLSMFSVPVLLPDNVSVSPCPETMFSTALTWAN